MEQEEQGIDWVRWTGIGEEEDYETKKRVLGKRKAEQCCDLYRMEEKGSQED